MADWHKLSAMLVAMGFQLYLFSMCSMSNGTNRIGSSSDKIEALIISGFVAYILAFLFVLFVALGTVTQHKVATICFIVLAFTAAILPMAGLGIYIDEHNSDPEKYSATIMCSAAILAVLGGIFSICGLAGC